MKIAQPHFHSYKDIGIYPDAGGWVANNGNLISPNKVPYSFKNIIIASGGGEYSGEGEVGGSATERLQNDLD